MHAGIAGFPVPISGHMSRMPYAPHSGANTVSSNETAIAALLLPLRLAPLPLIPSHHPLTTLSSPLLDATKASRLFQNKSKSVILFQEDGFDPHLFMDTYFR